VVVACFVKKKMSRKRRANKALQQTGHATTGSSCFSAKSA
jgi:hypothetical protein